MKRLEEKLQEIKIRKRIGLMMHVIVGYPTLDDTLNLVNLMTECGVDIIELQIPFSDPLADGSTIMKACEQSLSNGTKVKDAFEIMSVLSKKVQIPLLFMAYYNTVFKYGVEQFCKDAATAGATGLIVPDMPIEEEKQEHFYSFCQRYNLHAIHVISPVSTEERLAKNAAVATGFVYATARQGITGLQDELPLETQTYLKKIKQTFPVPVAVGFGISKPEHIQVLQNKADIAVIGSALIAVIEKSRKSEVQKNVKAFIQSLVV